MVVAFLLVPAMLLGEVKPSPLFGDHAVLQQGMTVPVWGTASAGERVTVGINGQSRQAVADAAGKWRVELADLGAGGPFELTIAGSDGQGFIAHDVLVGEVWLASGQSNMDFTVAKTKEKYFAGTLNEAEEIAAADYPKIRMFTVPLKTAEMPQSEVVGSWKVCSPQTVGDFSAVGYFFARDLYKHRDVPVGIITSAFGASTAQAWIRREALMQHPALASFVTDLDAACAAYASGEAQKQYEKRLAEWTATTQSATRPARAPRRPGPPRDPNKQEVGRRLAMTAQSLAYGEAGEYTGPTFKSMTVEGSNIRIRFDHVGDGLVCKTSTLSGFAIAPSGGAFVWAEARIDGNSVIVHSDQVSAPAAVRYAWADNPPVSLFSKAGLPAFPFRTDRPAKVGN